MRLAAKAAQSPAWPARIGQLARYSFRGMRTPELVAQREQLDRRNDVFSVTFTRDLEVARSGQSEAD